MIKIILFVLLGVFLFELCYWFLITRPLKRDIEAAGGTYPVARYSKNAI